MDVTLNKMKLACKFLIIIASSVLFAQCENNNNPNHIQPVSDRDVYGVVQKGPFINGTTITISELDADFNQTGKVYSTQIEDNEGNYRLNSLDFITQYVELKATGYYFNEVAGEVSASPVTLYSLADLSEERTLNINILSHLARNRMLYLIENGNSFEEAKIQAEQDLINIFSIEKPDMSLSHELDITGAGEDDAILLAVSVILQGFRTEAELSELIANINTDVRNDGIINNDENIGSLLLNDARLLNFEQIIKNLISRYTEMGQDKDIPDFEKYVKWFIDSTSFVATNLIDYPQYGEYGHLNILNEDVNAVSSFKDYSFAANLPRGTDLKIEMSGGVWYYQSLPKGPINWDISQYNHATKFQVFKAVESGTNTDLKIHFDNQNDSVRIDYFENQSNEPTKTKYLYIN